MNRAQWFQVLGVGILAIFLGFQIVDYNKASGKLERDMIAWSDWQKSVDPTQQQIEEEQRFYACRLAEENATDQVLYPDSANLLINFNWGNITTGYDPVFKVTRNLCNGNNRALDGYVTTTLTDLLIMVEVTDPNTLYWTPSAKYMSDQSPQYQVVTMEGFYEPVFDGIPVWVIEVLENSDPTISNDIKNLYQ